MYKSAIQELCNNFTQTVGIAVAVVDKSLIRIASTGRCSINQFLNINGLIQKQVIEQRKSILIENPTRDEACSNCEQKQFCKETLEISLPINIDDMTIGSISMITFTQKNRSKVLKNISLFMELSENFTGVIESFLSRNKSITEIKPKKEKRKSVTFSHLIGNAPQFLEVIQKAKLVSPNDVAVMIMGESGTGKEMLANAIHNASPRRAYPFVAINCGAIPENLMESELFGYVDGAFTGASKKGRKGKFELANNGTVFLDEITEMPISLQTNLLRILQEQQLERLGSNNSIDIDVRVIAATNKDIHSLINEGLFREDLYYRLNVIPLELPPLRERQDDIVPLMNYFMTKHSLFITKRHVQDFNVPKDIFEFFKRYNWPGNIRELENVIIHMLNMMDEQGHVSFNSLPVYIFDSSPNLNPYSFSASDIVPIEIMEKKAIEQALEYYGSTTEGKQATADCLGISLTTLYRKMKKHQMCLSFDK
ncbi:MAG: sigma 54-interacting transcriptional regulator [Bacteroidetes bacterium]|nr:sigma 54-interacting transcriptional regulator [Bacteroidota bacterium]